MDILLYHFPALCSRVTMHALEEIGLAYDDRLIDTRANEQNAPDYLAVNPKAKIPALAVDGLVLTENAAILHFLDQRFPDAGLLPRHGDPARDLQGLSDLVWCASALHPLVRQVRRPDKLTGGDPEPVRADGIAKFAAEMRRVAARIGDGWWYGERWSIVDSYVYWAYATARLGGFVLEEHPLLLSHAERVRATPGFQRVLAREAAALERRGITSIVL